MIHLSHREAWLILGILALLLAGNTVRLCRRPYVEFIPSRVETGAKVLDAPEGEDATTNGDD